MGESVPSSSCTWVANADRCAGNQSRDLQQTSPALRLPNELVGEIFQWTVRAWNRDYCQSIKSRHLTFKATTALSHICAAWRSFALNTLFIWTYIHMGWPLPAIYTFYERSKFLSLNLVWDDDTNFPTTTMRQRSEFFVARIPELASFRTMGSSNHTSEDLSMHPMNIVLRHPLPRTTSINIIFPFNTAGILDEGLFMSSASSLRSLSLYNIRGRLAPIAFSGIQILRLHYADKFFGGRDTIELYDIIDLLRRLPELEVLQFSGEQDSPSIVSRKELHRRGFEASHLHTLVMDGLTSAQLTSLFSIVKLPCLRSVKLATPTADEVRLGEPDYPASILRYFDDIPDTMRTILQRGRHLAVCVESGWGLEEMLFTLKPDDGVDAVSPPLLLLERGPEERIAHYEEDLTQNWFFGVNNTIGRLAHYFPLSQLLSFSCKFTDFGPRVGGGLGWEPLFRELQSLERLEMAGLHYLDYISSILSPKPDELVFCPALRTFKIIGKTIPPEPSVVDMFRLRKSRGHMVTELIFTPYDWDELLQLPIDSVNNYREMLSCFQEHVGIAKILVLHSSNSIFAWKSRHDLLEYYFPLAYRNFDFGQLFELDFGQVAEAGADRRPPFNLRCFPAGRKQDCIKAPANARIRLSSLESVGQMEDIVLSSSNAGSAHGSLSPESQSHALRQQQNCPALRLPNEIVGEIFEWTVRANQDFDTFYGTNNRVSFKHTMALSQITELRLLLSWAAALFGVLLLWGLGQFGRIYSRSNSAPLNLVWHNEYHHWHDSTMDQRGDLVLEKIPELASLRIMGVESSPGDNLYQTMVAVLRRPLPRTTFIHITFPFSKPGDSSDSLFMGSAPSLTSLSLFNINGSLASITFAGLRVLRLHFADRRPGRVETVELFDLIDLLRRLPYLEILQFARSSDAAAIVCNHELPLEGLEASHLHTLILDGLESSAISSLLSRMELPSLERIKLATCVIEPGRLRDEGFPHSTLLRYLQDNVPENVRKIQQQGRHLGLRVDSGSWYEEVSISLKPNDDPDASDTVFPPMVVFERGLDGPFNEDQQDVWLRGVDDTIGRLAHYFPVSQLLSFSFKFTDFKFRFTGGQGWEPLFRELRSLEKIELSCPNHLVNICSILSPKSDGSVFCPSLRTFQILGWKVPYRDLNIHAESPRSTDTHSQRDPVDIPNPAIPFQTPLFDSKI
ncbi:hypothetical protein SISNIDRAFT_467448 [Sistotremastrum niveocremeum HHB9708]|uniref:F-box domain-containing protein n=1 Tax=Sistotremastrum niveocremeum HHB9708 TaxID=1314777 RepID=A0A164SWA4_9AGAM|nr:hypothetical protein SISNIDRAFT_467448 [Sistotremastrum niveocremeum HHB9708]